MMAWQAVSALATYNSAMGLLDALRGKHSEAAPILELFERQLMSFRDTLGNYPDRPGSIPTAHQVLINETFKILRFRRNDLEPLVPKMTVAEGKKYGDLIRLHDALSMEWGKKTEGGLPIQ